MSAVGRTMLVIVMVIGVFSMAAGIACLVGADSWAGQVDDADVDSGVFIGAGAGILTLGVILTAISSLFLFRRRRPNVDTKEKVMPDE